MNKHMKHIGGIGGAHEQKPEKDTENCIWQSSDVSCNYKLQWHNCQTPISEDTSFKVF